jgi:hypothetical protein
MLQCSSNLLFEHMLPPFEIEKEIWFWHENRRCPSHELI